MEFVRFAGAAPSQSMTNGIEAGPEGEEEHADRAVCFPCSGLCDLDQRLKDGVLLLRRVGAAVQRIQQCCRIGEAR